MKANELMIGDLCVVNKDVSLNKGTIVKVVGIDSENTLKQKGLVGSASCIDVTDPDECSCGVWCEYLTPIPLTTEILEKNGFEYKGKESGLYGATIAPHYVRDDVPFEVFCDGEPFAIWFREPVNIKFVHELQRALGLCGIEKEIEL